MTRIGIGVAVLITLGIAPGMASPVVAVLRSGDITLEDLESHLRRREVPRETAEEREVIEPLLRQALRDLAVERSLMAWGEEHGALSNPSVQARLMMEERVIRLAHAERAIIAQPLRPSSAEVSAAEASWTASQPERADVTWRYMRFARDTGGRTAAERALESLGTGMPFGEVASREALPPVAGAPGELLRTAVGGAEVPLVEPVARVLLELEPGTHSGIVETPAGPVILRVESRERQGGRLSDGERALMEMELWNRRVDRARPGVLRDLAMRHPVEVTSLPASPALDAEALRAGARAVTVRDLWLRAHMGTEPSEEFRWLLSPEGRERVAQEEVLLAEADAQGLSGEPVLLAEIQSAREGILRQEILQRLERTLIADPTSAEIETAYLASAERHRGSVLTLELARLPMPVLQSVASGETMLSASAAAEEIRRRWQTAGEIGEVLQALRVSSAGVSRERLEDVWQESLPEPVRGVAERLTPGEVVASDLSSAGVLLIRLGSRRSEVHPLEEARDSVRQALLAERRARLDLTQALLESEGYREVWDLSRVAWLPDGSLQMEADPSP
ncbi:MAG: hypothetical protein HUU25_11075 [Candidatus Sumerlaeia bacterium]|nr:hypothetical protein [Candidatus Sumerlaeia bacterium]